MKYNRLRSQFSLTMSHIAWRVLVVFLNIRTKHALAIASDCFIRDASIVLLTKTQVLHNYEGNSMQSHFQSHKLLMHNAHLIGLKALLFKKNQYLI